ncbi:MAG: tetratricopeptide repeat protein [Terriglobia bacterium]
MKLALFCLFATGLAAQNIDPAYDSLSKAFDALKLRDYDTAILLFTKAAAISPQRADIRKNLAYTLLKTGENEAARMQFGEAMRIDPADSHVALEYAFLSFETHEDAPAHKAEARRIFDRIRNSGNDEASRATAADAFRNIDEPLQTGIARWQQALLSTAPTFSAHYELAQLAEQRDALDLAAGHYLAAFRMLPTRKSVLLELARVEKARNNPAGAIAALLAASRGGEPRTAEMAREQLPGRYPYVYEFRDALKLDPSANALHRELAYLLLRMSQDNQAASAEVELEFKAVVESSPDDYYSAAQLGLLYLASHRDDQAMPLLRNVLAHGDSTTANRVRMALHMPLVLENRQAPESPLDPRVLGERSYNAGFLKDALRYYTLANESDPIDASVALKLGWTNNLLHDDQTALRWFAIARRSSDPKIAAEAQKAWGNLHPAFQRIRTTVWVYPLYSTRWRDVFGYGQAKADLRVAHLPFRPYLSVRFVGDARQTTGGASPQSLSESAFIIGAGMATRQWRGGMAWFEAGRAKSYLNGTGWLDYRGGISFARTLGRSLAAEHGGMFLETTDDSVFVGHFHNDLLNVSQNKMGYTNVWGGLKVQAFLGTNLTIDVKKQYWANFVEIGPGLRVHPPGLPASVSITVNEMRGVYLINQYNPRRPNFFDFRAGVWYAFTK